MSSNIILETLVSVAHGIARQFGNNCEVCIHELKEEDLEHTILFIINGGITGRKVGEGASNVVLKTIEKIKKGEPIVDHLSYLTKASNGKILKSSTVFIKDMNEFAQINEVYAEFFGENKPARACVEVARLPKDVKVEIEVIAVVK